MREIEPNELTRSYLSDHRRVCISDFPDKLASWHAYSSVREIEHTRYLSLRSLQQGDGLSATISTRLRNSERKRLTRFIPRIKHIEIRFQRARFNCSFIPTLLISRAEEDILSLFRSESASESVLDKGKRLTFRIEACCSQGS